MTESPAASSSPARAESWHCRREPEAEDPRRLLDFKSDLWKEEGRDKSLLPFLFFYVFCLLFPPPSPRALLAAAADKAIGSNRRAACAARRLPAPRRLHIKCCVSCCGVAAASPLSPRARGHGAGDDSPRSARGWEASGEGEMGGTGCQAGGWGPGGAPWGS